MVKLPEVPNLDPSAPTAVSMAPAPAAVAAPLAGGLEEALFGGDGDLASPASAPATTAAPVTAHPALAPAEDSVEEMLSQASETLLRLARVEDAVGQLTSAVDDTREEMHAGLAELRSLITELQQQPKSGGDVSMISRFDALDAQTTTSTAKLHGRMVLLIGLQVVVAVVLGLLMWSARPAATSSAPLLQPSPAVPSEVSGMPKPEGVGDEDDVDDGKSKAKRRRKRKGAD